MWASMGYSPLLDWGQMAPELSSVTPLRVYPQATFTGSNTMQNSMIQWEIMQDTKTPCCSRSISSGAEEDTI